MLGDLQKAIQESKNILATFGVDAPPVPLADIVTSQGLNIIYADFSDIAKGNEIAGFIDFDNKRIVVNKDDSPNRQRFTIAHELGHYLLHKEYVQDVKKYKVLLRRPLKNGSYALEEKEANCFAAYLLVPSNLLKKYEKLPNSINASLFAVSEDVIAYSKKRTHL